MTLINCDYCGDEFNKKPSLIERSEKDFCSTECAGNWRSENKSGKDHPQYDRITVSCANCDKEKKVTPSHHEQTDNHFCDPVCQNKYYGICGEDNPSWSGGKIERSCDYCNKNMQIYPYRDKKSENNFCSQKCRGLWMSKNLSGDNHPLYEGYSENYGNNWNYMRRMARKRDNYTCQICGKDKEELNKNPDVHHIISVNKFDDPSNANYLDNLICLCKRCHGKVEQHSATPSGMQFQSKDL